MKKFKDTKVGNWLKVNAPKVLDTVGDLLPSSGVYGIVKNLISKTDLTAEQRKEFEEMDNVFILELLHLEAEDRAGARTREVDFIRLTGHVDWFMMAFGGVVLLLFAYTIYVSSTGQIPVDMREIFIEGRAAVRDIVLTIAAYYWGSSNGSRIKDMVSKLGNKS